MTFLHERLVGYQLSVRLAAGVERLAAELPRGHADLKDQVRRAASSTMRNIAEGANRWTPKDKCSRFVIARGECGECDAALRLIQELALADVSELRSLADRVAVMISGLIRVQQKRLANSCPKSKACGTRP